MTQNSSFDPYVEYFFFLIIRRPPKSTLFPYTRSSDLSGPREKLLGDPARRSCGNRATKSRGCRIGEAIRSEEHTSELQSLTNLVCRLLLEKKKLNTTAGRTHS